jgi:hypothetical protein
MVVRSLLRLSALAVLILVGAPSIVAQNVDSVRASYILPAPPSVELPKAVYRSAPGSSSGSPTAYGAEFGDVFLDAGYQDRTRYTKGLPWSQRCDGAVAGGFGLGSPRNALGIELEYTSFSTIRSGFFRTSSFSFKVHRALPWNLAVAFGWDDAIHSAGTDGGSSKYGVLTSYIRTRETSGTPFSSVTLSLGVGNGRFQHEEAFYAGKHGVGAFGSVGVRVLSPASLFADWTGQDLMLGASIVPFAKLPIFITPSFADVTGSAGDGARFVLGVGMAFNFSND